MQAAQTSMQFSSVLGSEFIDHQLRRRHGFLFSPDQSILRRENDNSSRYTIGSQHSFQSASDFGLTEDREAESRDGVNISSKRKNADLLSVPEMGSDPPLSSEYYVLNGLGFIFCKRFVNLNGILFSSTTSVPSLLLSLLLLLCLLGEFMIYQLGLIPSQYYKVLTTKDLNGFWIHTGVATGLIVAVATVKSSKVFIGKLLALTWRQGLCSHFHEKYFARLLYYQINVLDKIIDNPDQRMTQDIDKFTTIYGDILPNLLIAPFVIGYYSYQAFTRAGVSGPLGCCAFFSVGIVINRLVMYSIVKLTILQEKCEGDFRFNHMLIRINSESIAFQDGARREGTKAGEYLERLIQTQGRLYVRQYVLDLFVSLHQYIGSILSYMILAVPIFSGVYDSLSSTELTVVISQNSFVNMYLLYQFSQLMDLSKKIAEVVGLTHRLSQLLERLDELSEIWKRLFPPTEESPRSDFEKLVNHRCHPTASQNTLGDATLPKLPLWELTNVSYAPPFFENLLVLDLNLTIYLGESLLIMGGSSAGKSSFLRLLRGLWPASRGYVQRLHPPGPQGIFFCPQKPYLSIGTLREQVCFPLKHVAEPHQMDVDRTIILNYFSFLQLNHVLDRVGGIDKEVSWSVYESLSPGEVQRLAFIRVFFHLPLVAVLDESTSAVSEDMEEIIYGECRRLRITTISVAHRQSVKNYHNKILRLDGSGGWVLEKPDS